MNDLLGEEHQCYVLRNPYITNEKQCLFPPPLINDRDGGGVKTILLFKLARTFLIKHFWKPVTRFKYHLWEKLCIWLYIPYFERQQNKSPMIISKLTVRLIEQEKSASLGWANETKNRIYSKEATKLLQ